METLYTEKYPNPNIQKFVEKIRLQIPNIFKFYIGVSDTNTNSTKWPQIQIQWWQTAPAAAKNLNISFKCCSKYKLRDSFEICLFWGFQNTPNMLKLIEFWLRYLRSKKNDMILKNSLLRRFLLQVIYLCISLHCVSYH